MQAKKQAPSPAPPAPAGYGNAWRADLPVGKKVQFKFLFLCCT